MRSSGVGEICRTGDSATQKGAKAAPDADRSLIVVAAAVVMVSSSDLP